MRKSGVKFGLIGTASSLKKGASSSGKGRPIGSKPAPRRRPPGATSVFDANSDDEEGPAGDIAGVAAVNKRLAAISAKQEKQAKKEYEDALEADPSVFDYDRVYDGMKESRESHVAAATVAREKEKRQPKYIGNLLKQAKMRAVESDRIFDRKLQKEREEQDKLEGEATMKFVTSAYKKKLMEQKKWELQQQLEEERETRNDVTKTGMSGFYSNLITKNIAMGGDVEKSANSAFTTGSKRHAATAEYEMQDGNAKPAAKTDTASASPEGAAATMDAGGADAGGKEMEENADGLAEPAGPSARMVDPRAADLKEKSRGGTAEGGDGDKDEHRESGSFKESSSSQVRRREEGGATEEDAFKRARVMGDESRRPSGAVGDSSSGVGVRNQGSGGGGGGGGGERQGQEDDERTAEEKKAAEAAEKGKKAAAAKEKKEAAVKAARERFLARKKTAA